MVKIKKSPFHLDYSWNKNTYVTYITLKFNAYQVNFKIYLLVKPSTATEADASCGVIMIC